MDISLKNLGPIQEANFTLGDFTIICGRNNTGKTYVTYATYGFLDYWRNSNAPVIDSKYLSQLENSGNLIIAADRFKEFFLKHSNEIARLYSENISKIFRSKSNYLSECKLTFHLNLPEDMIQAPVDVTYWFQDGGAITTKVSKTSSNDLALEFYMTLGLDGLAGIYGVQESHNEAVKSWLSKNIIPTPFIASAERTGAALFQREVDFSRSRIIDLLKETDLNPQQLLGQFTADYPLPVKHNIDFVRNLPNLVKKEGEFAQQHPDILQTFTAMLGGQYEVSQTGDIHFTPEHAPTTRLSLAESSSTVRSLVDIGFWLKHQARVGDLLMVDEPELNLHPENQRKIARLFALLVNRGIKVLITTHSDYIIKELNTLLLLNKPDDERLQNLAQREGYSSDELLQPEQLKVYMTQPVADAEQPSFTLVAAPVSAEEGINLASFDDTIEDMNRIQDEIIWG